MGINMVKNRKRIYFLLTVFVITVIILGLTIHYIRNNTVIFMNQEVYVDVINESEIHVKGLPANTENFSETYMIKKTDALKILDRQGREIDFESLNVGNILIFDYKGLMVPKSGSYLNRGIYDVRLSGEVFNNKFWNVEFGDEKSRKSQPEQTLTGNQTEEKKQEGKKIQDIENSEPRIVTADYEEKFHTIQGCAVIFDTSKNIYTFYNEKECKEQVSPCSTFKVISSLMGIHNQIVTSKESKMGYSGVKYPTEAWNTDLSLADAFQNSCVWYFRKIIDEVGQEEVRKELQSLNYGNCDISEWNGNATNSYPELNGFWLESSLKISPLEQVDILRNIIEGKTIYSKNEVDILKSIMLIEENKTEKIYGKTGTGTNGNAWFIGAVEKDGSNTYFAIYLNDSTSDMVSGAKAREIALSILDELHIS
jgi:beta-lactamase class D